MNRLFFAGLVVSLGVVGCNKNNDTSRVPLDSGVTEIAPVPAGGYNSGPAPAPQPVVYDTMNTAPQPTGGYNSSGYNSGGYGNAPAAPMGGGTYTIRQGDTLFSIAKSRYGDGKQWTRIVQANPGLTPEKLKVGQTITIP